MSDSFCVAAMHSIDSIRARFGCKPEVKNDISLSRDIDESLLTLTQYLDKGYFLYGMYTTAHVLTAARSNN